MAQTREVTGVSSALRSVWHGCGCAGLCVDGVPDLAVREPPRWAPRSSHIHSKEAGGEGG